MKTESQSRRSGVAHPPLRPAMGKFRDRAISAAKPLGYADAATAFSHAMTYRPEDPEWEGRDRFPLSRRHRLLCSAAGSGNYPGRGAGNLRPGRQPTTDVSGMATYTP